MQGSKLLVWTLTSFVSFNSLPNLKGGGGGGCVKINFRRSGIKTHWAFFIVTLASRALETMTETAKSLHSQCCGPGDFFLLFFYTVTDQREHWFGQRPYIRETMHSALNL